MEKKFTIVYKTYKNDLEWFKWSLLSLKTFVNSKDILEILILLPVKGSTNVFKNHLNFRVHVRFHE